MRVSNRNQSKNIKRKRLDLHRQVLRIKSAPEKLKELIALVNLLPSDIRTALQIFLAYKTTDLQDWINEYLKDIERLPKQLQEFIGPVQIETRTTVSSRYNLLLNAKELLRAIAEGQINNNLALPITEALATLATDKKGKIVFIRTPLAEILEGVEAARIRLCPICDNVYWAGRIDQPTCSKRCGQTLRVRRWRGNYLEKYKPQRVLKESSTVDMKSKKGRK